MVNNQPEKSTANDGDNQEPERDLLLLKNLDGTEMLDFLGDESAYLFRVSVFQEKEPSFILDPECDNGFPIEVKKEVLDLSHKYNLFEIKDPRIIKAVVLMCKDGKVYGLHQLFFGSKCIQDCFNFIRAIASSDSLDLGIGLDIILGKELNTLVYLGC